MGMMPRCSLAAVALSALVAVLVPSAAPAQNAPAGSSSPLQGTAASALDLLARLDAERRALGSLSFRAEVATPKPRGRWGRSELTFSWKSPRSWRSELRMGIEGRLITVADGTKVWQYETRTRRVYVQNQDRALIQLRTHGPIDPVTALASPQVPLADLFVATSIEDSGSLRVLNLRPRRSVPGYDALRLAVATDGRTPVWAESLKAGRLIARITFHDWRRNPAIAEREFRFEIPRGIEPTILP